MTVDEALQWAHGTPEYRRMDIYQRDVRNEEAIDILAAEVRNLRALLVSDAVELRQMVEIETERDALQAEVRRLREALDRIAELPNLPGRQREAFDYERIAREALQRAGGGE